MIVTAGTIGHLGSDGGSVTAQPLVVVVERQQRFPQVSAAGGKTRGHKLARKSRGMVRLQLIDDALQRGQRMRQRHQRRQADVPVRRH
jgi:hypothetical protein